MPYINCISLNYAINELDLFDNIEYKYLKKLLNPSVDYDDSDFEVDIQDIGMTSNGYAITVVKFDLENPNYDAEDPWSRENKYIRFTKRYEYSGSSIMGLNFGNIWIDEETSDEEEEYNEEVVPVSR